MSTIGELFVKLKADTSNFTKGMDEAEKQTKKTTSQMRSEAAKLAAEYRKQGKNQSEAMRKA